MSPPADISINCDEIHVWRAQIDLLAHRVPYLLQILSEDEKERAKRFQFQKDRERFIVVRSLLRAILSRYVNVEANQLRFCYGPYGKPAMDTSTGYEVFRFNLSHSYELALYAIAYNREVGIDVELNRPIIEVDQIVERFFSIREKSIFRAMPSKLKHKAFLTCWTRKEAYLKARGTGLSLAFDQFDVSLVPGEPTKLLDSRIESPDTVLWSIQELYPGHNYVAALAFEGEEWQLKCFDLSE
ncbi:MAG: 4'-phosphopantetheinyl transferase superfamily protein [Anaerolineales bacterium]|nr:4'-phosphopantetheinyl transferase superfamily protein [Anaerolineales bacterium]